MVITTTWCLWFHRNQVIFEGKQPNPTEVLLTVQSLINRYTEIPQHTSTPTSVNPRSPRNNTQLPEDWQILILTAGVGAKHKNWHDTAFIGKNRLGQVLFVGCQSLKTGDITMAKVTAIREASLLASRQGLRKIVILTNGEGIEKMWRTTRIGS